MDRVQKSHTLTAFTYAVIKKSIDDRGGHMAALLTYYGFLSLFPLLLVATSILQILLHSRPDIQQDIITHLVQYFPAGLSEQLVINVKDFHGVGFALIVGIFAILWGAKGVADVFQYTLNHIWGVPQAERPGFPKNSLKSLLIIIIGAAGFMAASFMSGKAASLDRGAGSRIISSLTIILILFCVFWTLFKLGLAPAAKAGNRALFRSSLFAAIGIAALQIVGGYLVTHQLSKLKLLYGAFAVTLGLLFWIYLQARLMIYAIEIGSVYEKKLWPRDVS
jgi:YihY family inner membrane protein